MEQGAKSQIETTVRELVASVSDIPVERIDAGSHLEQDLELDSLQLVELAVRLERVFELPPMAEGEALELETVGDIEALVERLVSERG